jgi:hypothetical protein
LPHLLSFSRASRRSYFFFFFFFFFLAHVPRHLRTISGGASGGALGLNPSIFVKKQGRRR